MLSTPNSASMRLDQAFRNVQTQAGAALGNNAFADRV